MEQYKVIETKFLPVTNNHGSRIKAFDGNKNQVTIGYPHELSGVECPLSRSIRCITERKRQRSTEMEKVRSREADQNAANQERCASMDC